MAAESEADIDENWCLIENQSTCNDFINSKYMSNIDMLLMDNIHVSTTTHK